MLLLPSNLLVAGSVSATSGVEETWLRRTLARLTYPAELLVAAIVHKAWFQNQRPDQSDISDGSSCVGVGRLLGSYEYRARRTRADRLRLTIESSDPQNCAISF